MSFVYHKVFLLAGISCSIVHKWLTLTVSKVLCNMSLDDRVWMGRTTSEITKSSAREQVKQQEIERRVTAMLQNGESRTFQCKILIDEQILAQVEIPEKRQRKTTSNWNWISSPSMSTKPSPCSMQISISSDAIRLNPNLAYLRHSFLRIEIEICRSFSNFTTCGKASFLSYDLNRYQEWKVEFNL
eukprot:TRINITY_DN6545_c0_g1_i9.p1 TRINITY_DN6545_c0_g1~~TRINITY_DN6545_c0_g1_i9.p1  ORF type:complete len:186 (+),score=43.59 TRINITY_DN6545_c0_g1_i9:190-747(+)